MPGRLVLAVTAALSIVACGAGVAGSDPQQLQRSSSLTTSQPVTVVIEAEAMARTPASAGQVYGDTTASGGAAQILWSNGSLDASTTLTSPATQVVVRALGDQCSGAPQMVVRVDGASVGTVSVKATTWTDYPLNVSLSANVGHAIQVAFVNDFSNPRCDRNLKVDRVGFVTAPSSSRTPVKLGAAVNHYHLFDAHEPAYAATVEREFDSITAEYEMKMDQVVPNDPNTYDFSLGDQLLAYANAHGKELRGHALIWHRALPSWLTSRSWTRDELLAFLRTYVANVVGHYGDGVPEWDVVNEAFNDDGTYRSSIWHDVIDDPASGGHDGDYVVAAFQAARAANSKARLYYNDYGIEWANAKSDAALNLVNQLKQAGFIDGVGFQSHFTASWYPSQDQFGANIARFAAAGVDVGVTEMDVAMGGAQGSPTQKMNQEAAIYGGIAQACQAQPACKRFTVWGVTDKYTWLSGSDIPLLFDTQYAAKPAYAAVRAALPR